MTTNRVRPQWTKRPRSQRAGENVTQQWTDLYEAEARVKAMSDADLAAEVDRLRGEVVADSSVALDPEWSRYSTLVITEQRTRKG